MIRWYCAVFLLAASLASCSSPPTPQDSGAREDLSSTNAIEPQAAEPPVVVSTPNFAEREGNLYHYSTAVSDDEKAEGRAVGQVITFRYLGRQGNKHVLESVGAEGQPLGRNECSEPCRIIVRRFGRSVDRLPFDPGSVIGAAFEDAIDGRLIPTREEVTADQSAHQFSSNSYGTIASLNGQTTTANWQGKNGRCRLVVSGQTYINGACRVRLDADGSFQIMSSDEKYFAQLSNSEGAAHGFWNETPNASYAHASLGGMVRNGACWNNDDAEICAWRE